MIIILMAMIVWGFVFYKRNQFQKSTYKQETDSSFFKVISDKGLIGEYYTVNVLDRVPGYHKTLVNAYIPKKRGGTTEIDIIFLHEKGIFVLESKNYSGWIFGKEQDRYWTQSLPNGKKKRFFNPIMQNRGHVNALQQLLQHLSPNKFYSYIVFSERCQLKKVTLDSADLFVLKRNQLGKVLRNHFIQTNNVFTQTEIDEIYQTLKPYTQVQTETKTKHIESIKRM